MMPTVQAKALSYLVGHLGVYTADVFVCGISDDTRRLRAGDIFLCLPRAKQLPVLVAQAIKQGAVAIVFVGGVQIEADIPCAYLPNMDAAGLLLRRWFGTESAHLPCIGITGTDGKTSTAWLLRETLALQLGSAWSCGTLGLVRQADDITDLGNTTPSLLTLHALLAAASQYGIGALVIEVSSHGIAQERVAGLPFQAVIWTTMGRDHLEDHGGFEAYLACKADFVRGVAAQGGQVIANADYAWIEQALAGDLKHISRYAKEPSKHQHVDLTWSTKSQHVQFKTMQETVVLQHMPVADFHAENLAAVALLIHTIFNLPLADFAGVDGKLSTPMGRLEPVDEQQQVFIDYAHTAEGLARCLRSAKALTEGRLLLVFGCGGDRDKAKRPKMGAVAVKYSEQCWLTSDNPRSEKQAAIAADVLQGVVGTIHVVEDREQAIFQAVSALAKGDILVVAGKGHEHGMEIQGKRLPWSDKDVVLRALAEHKVIV